MYVVQQIRTMAKVPRLTSLNWVTLCDSPSAFAMFAIRHEITLGASEMD